MQIALTKPAETLTLTPDGRDRMAACFTDTAHELEQSATSVLYAARQINDPGAVALLILAATSVQNQARRIAFYGELASTKA